MDDSQEPLQRPQAPIQASRTKAFRAAGRHSARVRLFRKAIIGAAVFGTLAVLILAFFNPFRKMPENISVGTTGITGTKITMDLPKMNGYRKDGRPYDVRAARGIQDIRSPSIIHLEEVNSNFAMQDRSSAKVSSNKGVYDSNKEFMVLNGDVRIQNPGVYDMRLSTADLDFKNGTLQSKAPTTVALSNGTIAADSVEITQNGQKVTFTGNVKSVMDTDDGSGE